MSSPNDTKFQDSFHNLFGFACCNENCLTRSRIKFSAKVSEPNLVAHLEWPMIRVGTILNYIEGMITPSTFGIIRQDLRWFKLVWKVVGHYLLISRLEPDEKFGVTGAWS